MDGNWFPSRSEAFLTSEGGGFFGVFTGTFGLRGLKPWEGFQCDYSVVAACQRARED